MKVSKAVLVISALFSLNALADDPRVDILNNMLNGWRMQDYLDHLEEMEKIQQRQQQQAQPLKNTTQVTCECNVNLESYNGRELYVSRLKITSSNKQTGATASSQNAGWRVEADQEDAEKRALETCTTKMKSYGACN